MMPSWSADAQKFWAYDSLNRIEWKWIKCRKKLRSKSLRPVNQLCKFLHFNMELIDQSERKITNYRKIKTINRIHNDW